MSTLQLELAPNTDSLVGLSKFINRDLQERLALRQPEVQLLEQRASSEHSVLTDVKNSGTASTSDLYILIINRYTLNRAMMATCASAWNTPLLRRTMALYVFSTAGLLTTVDATNARQDGYQQTALRGLDTS
jgi:hypothetical protein